MKDFAICYKMVEVKYTAYKDAGSDGNKTSGNAISRMLQYNQKQYQHNSNENMEII